MLSALLFDIDGTLVDSNEFHVLAWHYALSSAGLNVPLAAIRKQIGKGADQLLPALAPKTDEAERKRIAQLHDERFKSHYLHRVAAFPGAARVIRDLYGEGLHLVLASSAKREEVDFYVRLLNIAGLLDATTCADDVARSKPAGDIFVSALARIAPIGANSALAVGDTAYDMISAAKAGVRSVGVLTGPFNAQELTSAGALATFGQVASLTASRLREIVARRSA